MTQRQSIGVFIAGLTVVIAMVLLLFHVGGQGIRTTSSIYEFGALILNTRAVTRGVPVKVRLENLEWRQEHGGAAVMLRDSDKQVVLGTVPVTDLMAGQFRVVLPCENNIAGAGSARLVLLNGERRVMAQSDEMTLLDAGPECFY